jgi:hypothetical protein
MKLTSLVRTLCSVSVLLVGVTAYAGTPMAQTPPLAPSAPVVTAQPEAVPFQVECDDAAIVNDGAALETLATPATPVSAETQAAACKTCAGKKYCKCTYNGMHRASCDPCCYANDIGVLTCLD